MTLLAGFKVVQIGGGSAAAVCGRLLADVGAQVTCIGPDASTTLLAYLNQGKAACRGRPEDWLAAAHLIVREGSPNDRPAALRLAELRRINPSATIVTISPYGETGPKANDPATDLTLFFASGIARQLTGQVDDLSEAPIRPVGEQSAFIGGLAAACAGMHAALGNQPGASIDVSIQEALATLSVTELARAGLERQELGPQARRRRQRRDRDDPAGERRLCRDLAARGEAVGGVAAGDGIARRGAPTRASSPRPTE